MQVLQTLVQEWYTLHCHVLQIYRDYNGNRQKYSVTRKQKEYNRLRKLYEPDLGIIQHESERDDSVKKAAGLRKELTELQNVINGECEMCDTFVVC